MKQTPRKATVLQGNNLASLKKALGNAPQTPPALGLLYLIADLLDTCARGEHMYMILGTTSKQTAFSVTIKGDNAPDPFYGESLDGLGVLAVDLL